MGKRHIPAIYCDLHGGICLSSALAPTSPHRTANADLQETGIFLHKGNSGIINNEPTVQCRFIPPLTQPHGFSYTKTSLRLLSATAERWQLTSPFCKKPAQKFRLPVASVFGQQFKATHVTKVLFSPLEKSLQKPQGLHKIIATSANYCLSLQIFKQEADNFNTRAVLIVFLHHLPSQREFAQFFTKELSYRKQCFPYAKTNPKAFYF